MKSTVSRLVLELRVAFILKQKQVWCETFHQPVPVNVYGLDSGVVFFWGGLLSQGSTLPATYNLITPISMQHEDD